MRPGPFTNPVSNPLAALGTMAGDLERVEAALARAVASDNPMLTEIASHLIVAGGKRVRPGFAIAAAGIGTAAAMPASHPVIMGAVAVELVHLGSLYHDDVMDEAMVRRNVPSVNARWGNLKAILAGDFLLARASEIAAALGTEVAGLLAATIGRLCEGEVRQLEFLYRLDRPEEAYEQAIAGKTASLLASACRIGGIVADLPRPDVEALTEFGHGYGMAFQVVDDILDVVATESELGKPAGIDLLEGNYTLPVLRAARSAVGGELRELLGAALEPHQLERVRGLVRASGGVEQALDVARSYADKAAAALATLPDSQATAALRLASDHLLDRVAAAAR